MIGGWRVARWTGVWLLVTLLPSQVRAAPGVPEFAAGQDPPAGVPRSPASAGPGEWSGEVRPGLSAEGIQMVHTVEDSALARSILDAILELPPLVGVPGGRPVNVEVVLAPDEETYAKASGGRPPHWSAAVAIPSRSRIVLPAWPGATILGEGREGLLRHEWAHVGMYQASGGLRAPRWFSEGYAEWAGGWDRGRAWRLRVLLALGQAPPLDSLSLAWPAGRAPAESAYLLSASVVEYLHERSGARGLEVLFRRWREAGSFEEGFRRTYGLTTGQVEEDWRAWARSRYGWLFVLTHSGLAWAALTGLLLGLVSFRRRYDRERMARLRARELPEEPAWWDGRGSDGSNEGDHAAAVAPQPAEEGGDGR